MNETFADYETGMVELRKRVVTDLKRKLIDRRVPTTRKRTKPSL